MHNNIVIILPDLRGKGHGVFCFFFKEVESLYKKKYREQFCLLFNFVLANLKILYLYYLRNDSV